MNETVLERGSPEKDATSSHLRMRDATLPALAKAGDDNAYVELIKHCFAVALRAVRRIVKTEADAEVFYRGWRWTFS